MIFKPLHDNILVEVVKEKKTSFGLIIPEMELERVAKGYVCETGSGRYDFKTGTLKQSVLKKGDCVLFNKNASVELVDSGKSYVIISEDNVYGIVI